MKYANTFPLVVAPQVGSPIVKFREDFIGDPKPWHLVWDHVIEDFATAELAAARVKQLMELRRTAPRKGGAS